MCFFEAMLYPVESLAPSPLPIGAFKLNIDGSSMGNRGLTGFRCIFRDHSRRTRWVICGPLLYQSDGAWLVMGLRKIKEMDVRGCLVEGDSKVVVHWGLGKALGSWHLLHFIHEIRFLVKLLDVSLFFVLHDRNDLVGSFAKVRVLRLDIFKGSSLPNEV